jgi:hypothetical protein
VERIFEAVRRRATTLDDPGFCLSCGEEVGGCEPDAERYECDNCGARRVYGSDWLLILVAP